MSIFLHKTSNTSVVGTQQMEKWESVLVSGAFSGPVDKLGELVCQAVSSGVFEDLHCMFMYISMVNASA